MIFNINLQCNLENCPSQVPKVSTSYCMFCPTNSSKVIQFTTMIDEENQQTFTFQKVKPENSRYFCLEHYHNRCRLSLCRLTDQLIN